MDIPLLFIHSLAGGYLSHFQVWVFFNIMDDGAMSIMYKFPCGQMFSFLLDVYLGGTYTQQGQMVILCLAVRGTARLFPDSGHTILHAQQQCLRIPISSHPHQHRLFSLKKIF